MAMDSRVRGPLMERFQQVQILSKIDQSELSRTLFDSGKFGEVYCCRLGDHVFAQKIVPSAIKHNDDHRYAPAREIYSLRCCNELTRAWVVPNLPLLIDFAVRESCGVSTAFAHIKTKNPPCVAISQEWLDLTFLSYIVERNKMGPIHQHEWRSYYFQIMAGIASMHRHYSILHRDLHWNNIMVKRCTRCTVRYTVDCVEFYVKTYGVVLIINDWGNSHTISAQTLDGTDIVSFSGFTATSSIGASTKTFVPADSSTETSILKMKAKDYMRVFYSKAYLGSIPASSRIEILDNWLADIKRTLSVGDADADADGVVSATDWILKHMLEFTSTCVGMEHKYKQSDLRSATRGNCARHYIWRKIYVIKLSSRGNQVLILAKKHPQSTQWVHKNELYVVAESDSVRAHNDTFDESYTI